MIVVFDANLYISAFISSKGIPSQLITDYWMRQKAFTVAVSPPILDEIERVLHYPRFRKYKKFNDEQIEKYLLSISGLATHASPTVTIDVSTDESDNRYIECAVTANAEYLVTGDKKHLLPIKEYEGVEIIDPRTFLTLLEIDFS